MWWSLITSWALYSYFGLLSWIQVAIYQFICCVCFCCTCLQLKLTISRDLCAWCCIMLRHKEIHIVRHSKTQFCRLWDFVKTHCCIAVRQTRLFSPTGSQNLDLLALHFAKLSDNRPYLWLVFTLICPAWIDSFLIHSRAAPCFFFAIKDLFPETGNTHFTKYNNGLLSTWSSSQVNLIHIQSLSV